MSREIKFRAWNGVDYVLTDEIEFQDIVSMQKKGFVFEQYTGLKDGNGKEIYEGDLLKDENGRIRIAVFAYGAFKVMWNNDNPTQLNLYPLNKHWEVIGNIHENPELMENVK